MSVLDLSPEANEHKLSIEAFVKALQENKS